MQSNIERLGFGSVIQGGARGVDSLAYRAALELGLRVDTYYANWKRDGKAAGPIRNQFMLKEGQPTMCLAFWDGSSKGTKDMIDRCRKAGIPVEIISI